MFIGWHHVRVAVGLTCFARSGELTKSCGFFWCVLLFGVLSSQAIHGDQQILELRMASRELEHRRVCWCWSTLDWVWQGDITRTRLLDTGGCTRAARRGAVRSRAQRWCPVQLGEWSHAGVHRQYSVQAHRLRHSPAATAKPTADILANHPVAHQTANHTADQAPDEPANAAAAHPTADLPTDHIGSNPGTNYKSPHP